jgi:7-cyano-7-deazaguanine reductase
LTDYSNASSAKAKLERPEDFKFDFIQIKKHDLVVEWVYPEFQSICPISKRHDQGELRLTYKPKDKILESKSVREYLSMWRNLHNWQEHITDEIADALYKAVAPVGLIVEIEWSPRGGIFAHTVAKKGKEI